jgi:predicted acetyltransferase
MNITLVKANNDDAERIHKMQVESFMRLLKQYQDYELNPAAEVIDKVKARFKQSFTDYYIIKKDDVEVGAIRIVNIENGTRFRISPMFIIPKYQNMGIGQIVIKKVEEMYKPKNGWELDTIKQEQGNCHLYEKMGYKRKDKEQIINERMTIVFYEKV